MAAMPFFLRRFLQHLATPRALAVCFLLSALPTGLACALLTPIGSFPDEQMHIVRADGLRYGEIAGMNPPPGFPPEPITAGVDFNKAIFWIISPAQYVELFPTPPLLPALRAAQAVTWGKPSYWPTQMVEYFPAFYAPAALALLAGETSGLSPLNTLFLGRVAMLLGFIALGTAALACARFGGALLFAVLTLPTLVNLASSYNQDGLMTATCVLAAALLTRSSPRARIIALILLSLVACAKSPYAPLLLICLLPSLSAGFWRRTGLLVLACIPPALWLWHIAHSGFQPNPSAPYHPGFLWPGDKSIWLHDTLPANNIKVLLAHPAEIITMPIVTLTYFWHFTWKLVLGMVGTDHGLLSPWEYPCLIASLACAALGSLRGWPKFWSIADGVLAALAIFAAFIVMSLSLYLTFTPAGMVVIMGIQARYFLPFLPFFIFILACAGSILVRLPYLSSLARIAPGWFCLPPVALAFVNTYALPAFIFHLYRTAGP